MTELIKKLCISILTGILKYLPQTSFTKHIARRAYMARLWREDILQWRLEMAKEMGAKVGENCRFYSLNMFSEPYLIEIGDDVIISGEVIFVTHDGGVYLFKNDRPNIFGHFGKIKIGNNCFIGMGAIILPNVEIGNNCIIGAGAVVVDSIPDDSVAMGNPAKVVFKTSMYKRMRLSSKATITHDTYAFPNHDMMPSEMKRSLLLDKVGELPIKKPRKR